MEYLCSSALGMLDGLIEASGDACLIIAILSVHIIIYTLLIQQYTVLVGHKTHCELVWTFSNGNSSVEITTLNSHRHIVVEIFVSNSILIKQGKKYLCMSSLVWHCLFNVIFTNYYYYFECVPPNQCCLLVTALQTLSRFLRNLASFLGQRENDWFKVTQQAQKFKCLIFGSVWRFSEVS